MSDKIRSVVPATYGDAPKQPPPEWWNYERVYAPHSCERCGRQMEFADQQCACSSVRGR